MATEFRYSISFDFDCEGEPPSVIIIDDKGTAILEIFEEPIKNGDDWQAGPLAKRILMMLNYFDMPHIQT